MYIYLYTCNSEAFATHQLFVMYKHINTHNYFVIHTVYPLVVLTDYYAILLHAVHLQ